MAHNFVYMDTYPRTMHACHFLFQLCVHHRGQLYITYILIKLTQWTEEIRRGGLHRSNPTVEKAHAMWPHQKPEIAFIAHRLLLDD